MTKPRILLADDHATVLGVLRRLLHDEFDIVGAVGDGSALVEHALASSPDAIVADVTMPGLTGLGALQRILPQRPHVRFVFLTVHEDALLAAEALRAGAAGYILKRSAVSELRAALREALAGRRYLTRLIAGGNPEALAAGGEVPRVEPDSAG